MFTHKDIEFRTIYVVNCIESQRILRVSCGELLLEEISAEKKKTLTKLPFQKILALFVVGHISITTPLIEKCKKFNIALVVMKPNLRPVFFWASTAEANYLLRQKQYRFAQTDLSIAKALMQSKFSNQLKLLDSTRRKDDATLMAKDICLKTLNEVTFVDDYNRLMGIEGLVAKYFFVAYFQDYQWKARKPRTKIDALNATLDIGYTLLFNFIESFVRMFGFDLYVGVYHRLWFKRKSLICDLIEPFRCIIDHTVRLAFNRRQCQEKDFEIIKNEYRLKLNKSGDYHRLFFDALIPYKMEIFLYVQSYYRCFMRGKPMADYPTFNF